ncbi:MAG: PAS domain S-box protein, partial [Proteobacteria bacterium]|nr:PAS domain S-box protein [Pseudomonadota bacterium]
GLLESLGVRICIPVGLSKQMVGLCFFGEKATGLPYKPSELNLASLLTAQAVSPIKNSFLHQQIVENNRILTVANESLKKEMAERKVAEKKATENEQHLRTILETANEGFWKVDRDGITLDVNPELCSILGSLKEDIVGRSIFEFAAPDSTDTVRDQLAIRKQGKSSSYELTLLRSDQSPVYCQVNATPLYDESDPTGRHVGSFGMVTDMSKRKQAEDDLQDYARIVSLSKDMMALIDLDGTNKKINDAYLEGFGQKSSEVLGRSFGEFFDPKMSELIQGKLERCFSGENVHFQSWFDLPGGEKRYLDVAFYPYVENGRKVTGAIMIMRDMTRVKNLEDHLQISQKMEA